MTIARTYTLTALTDIWTGSVRLEERNGQLRERIVPDRLITTGLLGSIRWWYEVLVRGLSGHACDSTREGNRCPDSRRRPTDPGHHCVVCELFGCTGWARKFRFEVLDEKGQPRQDQIKKGQAFKFRFTELRPIGPAEWALLDLTLRLIAEYGAIGGKTIYKPSDEAGRENAAHHRDYGLIEINNVPEDLPACGRDELERYVRQDRWRKVNHGDFAWASLANFWCVNGRYLARQNGNHSSFNHVIGRPEPKAQAGRNDSWLAGQRAGQGRDPESKKVFSFKDPVSARRTFGFVQAQDNLDEMKQRLREKAWKDLKDLEFVAGTEVLKRLLGQGGAA